MHQRGMRRRVILLWTLAVLSIISGYPVQARQRFQVNQANSNQCMGVLLAAGSGQIAAGLTIRNQGPAESFGTFTGGNFGISNGVVLTTGRLSDFNAPTASVPALPASNLNVQPDSTLHWDHPPKQSPLGDTAALTAQFTVPMPAILTFRYIFASVELPSYMGTQYNDQFTLVLNGQNIALLGNGQQVTINNLGRSSTLPSTWSPQYINATWQTREVLHGYMGYTLPLVASGAVQQGMQNTLNISISDVSDGYYDSAVFIEGGSLSITQTRAPTMNVVYSYRVMAWQPCSATCGGGTQFRQVQCISNTGQVDVSNQMCTLSSQGLPQSTQSCGNVPCPVQVTYGYTVSQWGPCSVSCGAGIMTRLVQCQSSQGQTVADTFCTNGVRQVQIPSSQQQCQLGPCVSYQYSVGPWGACSVSCGQGGQQSRQVSCMSSVGEPVSPSFCSIAVAPQTFQPCSMPACPAPVTYALQYGQWGACSVTCGQAGIQTRPVTCMSSLGQVVARNMCSETAEGLRKACSAAVQCATVSYNFVPGPWASCPVTCGVGTTTRSITCVSSDGIPVDMSQCTGTPPISAQTCDAGACESYGYKVSAWGSCSQTCGQGTRSRTVVCQSDAGQTVSDSMCGNRQKPVEAQTCSASACVQYGWAYSAWGECSSSCGSGMRSRMVFCRDSNANVVAESLCRAAKPDEAEGCSNPECKFYGWAYSAWGSCSSSCGSGTQARYVYCISQDYVLAPSESACASMDKPKSSQPCTQPACNTYSWRYEAWSVCSVTCGSGTVTRKVYCLASDGGQADESKCLGVRPASVQSCTANACPQYSWAYSAWRACSVTCGAGVVTRHVVCHEIQSGADADPFNCSGEKPASSKSCTQKDCIAYAWAYSAWGACAATCGPSTQTRVVVCQASNGGTVGDMFCGNAGPKPSTGQSCNAGPCMTYAYKSGPWGGCSVTCGNTGLMTRMVSCFDAEGKQVDDTFCAGTKPMTSEACINIPPCTSYAYGYSTWGACSVTCGSGGTRTRTIMCQSNTMQTVADSYCTGVKPTNTESCVGPTCLTYSYATSAWGPCSVPCGRGTVTRSVVCQSSAGLTVADQNCQGSKPANAQACDMPACTTTTNPAPATPAISATPAPVVLYRYAYSAWSQCSCALGLSGTRTREVYCLAPDMSEAPSPASCSGVRPESSESCSSCTKAPVIPVTPAPIAKVTYAYNCGQYGSCSVTCGSGMQTRTCTCMSSTNQAVQAEMCTSADLAQPTTSQACTMAACLAPRPVQTPVPVPVPQVSYFYSCTQGACSVTCGSGFTSSICSCMSSTGQTVNNFMCQNAGVQNQQGGTQQCTMAPCPALVPVPVPVPQVSYFYSCTQGACSVTCGSGFTSSTCSCMSSTGQTVNNFMCQNAGVQNQQGGTQQCTMAPCPAPVQTIPSTLCLVSSTCTSIRMTDPCFATLTVLNMISSGSTNGCVNSISWRTMSDSFATGVLNGVNFEARCDGQNVVWQDSSVNGCRATFAVASGSFLRCLGNSFGNAACNVAIPVLNPAPVFNPVPVIAPSPVFFPAPILNPAPTGCVDLRTDCNANFVQGMCQINADFMRTNCPVTCNLCGSGVVSTPIFNPTPVFNPVNVPAIIAPTGVSSALSVSLYSTAGCAAPATATYTRVQLSQCSVDSVRGTGSVSWTLQGSTLLGAFYSDSQCSRLDTTAYASGFLSLTCSQCNSNNLIAFGGVSGFQPGTGSIQVSGCSTSKRRSFGPDDGVDADDASALLMAIAAVVGVALFAAVASLLVYKKRNQPKSTEAPPIEMLSVTEDSRSTSDFASYAIAEQVGTEILV